MVQSFHTPKLPLANANSGSGRLAVGAADDAAERRSLITVVDGGGDNVDDDNDEDESSIADVEGGIVGVGSVDVEEAGVSSSSSS